jgi:chitinase
VKVSTSFAPVRFSAVRRAARVVTSAGVGTTVSVGSAAASARRASSTAALSAAGSTPSPAIRNRSARTGAEPGPVSACAGSTTNRSLAMSSPGNASRTPATVNSYGRPRRSATAAPAISVATSGETTAGTGRWPAAARSSTAGSRTSTPLAAATRAKPTGSTTTISTCPPSSRSARTLAPGSTAIPVTAVTPGTAASRSPVPTGRPAPDSRMSAGISSSPTRSLVASIVVLIAPLNTAVVMAMTSTATGPAVSGAARPARVSPRNGTAPGDRAASRPSRPSGHGTSRRTTSAAPAASSTGTAARYGSTPAEPSPRRRSRYAPSTPSSSTTSSPVTRRIDGRCRVRSRRRATNVTRRWLVVASSGTAAVASAAMATTSHPVADGRPGVSVPTYQPASTATGTTTSGSASVRRPIRSTLAPRARSSANSSRRRSTASPPASATRPSSVASSPACTTVSRLRTARDCASNRASAVSSPVLAAVAIRGSNSTPSSAGLGGPRRTSATAVVSGSTRSPSSRRSSIRYRQLYTSSLRPAAALASPGSSVTATARNGCSGSGHGVSTASGMSSQTGAVGSSGVNTPTTSTLTPAVRPPPSSSARPGRSPSLVATAVDTAISGRPRGVLAGQRPAVSRAASRTPVCTRRPRSVRGPDGTTVLAPVGPTLAANHRCPMTPGSGVGIAR